MLEIGKVSKDVAIGYSAQSTKALLIKIPEMIKDVTTTRTQNTFPVQLLVVEMCASPQREEDSRNSHRVSILDKKNWH